MDSEPYLKYVQQQFVRYIIDSGLVSVNSIRNRSAAGGP